MNDAMLANMTPEELEQHYYISGQKIPESVKRAVAEEGHLVEHLEGEIQQLESQLEGAYYDRGELANTCDEMYRLLVKHGVDVGGFKESDWHGY